MQIYHPLASFSKAYCVDANPLASKSLEAELKIQTTPKASAFK